jgi:large-conductance mechanosensitive channel
VIDFLIVAFCIFMVIKAMNKVKKKEEKPAEK